VINLLALCVPFVALLLFCCGDLQVQRLLYSVIIVANVSLLELRSILQNMRKRSEAFVKSCDFVQTVPTTPQYYSNHQRSQPVGTPQSVGIKGLAMRVLNKVSFLLIITGLALEGVHKNADLAIIIEPQQEGVYP